MAFHHPRKRFGQHFLKDKNSIYKILRALAIGVNDHIVEIGPGLGVLTTAILNHVGHLHVIEIDKDLSAKLQEAYSPEILTVHQHDVLEFDFAMIYHAWKPPAPLRLFGNLPYNISTPLLFYLINFLPIIKDMLFMLQKEVVMRMTAKTGSHEYGRLSIMIQYHCEAHCLFDVPKEAFSPPPKVTSSVIRLKPHGASPHPLAVNYPTFAQVVSLAFQHRRKTLKNALEMLNVELSTFAKANIDPLRRPQTLTVSEFVSLSNEFYAQICYFNNQSSE